MFLGAKIVYKSSSLGELSLSVSLSGLSLWALTLMSVSGL